MGDILITCCNTRFRGYFSYVLKNNENFYRRISYGICPICNTAKFTDYKWFSDGNIIIKEFKGKKAKNRFERWKTILSNIKQGTQFNQSFHYGDCKFGGKKDKNGIPIYKQLRRDFNNNYEIIGDVLTKIYNLTA